MRQRDEEGEARGERAGTMTHCKEPRVEETMAGTEADGRQRDHVWGAGLPQLLENPEKPQDPDRSAWNTDVQPPWTSLTRLVN